MCNEMLSLRSVEKSVRAISFHAFTSYRNFTFVRDPSLSPNARQKTSELFYYTYVGVKKRADAEVYAVC